MWTPAQHVHGYVVAPSGSELSDGAERLVLPNSMSLCLCVFRRDTWSDLADLTHTPGLELRQRIFPFGLLVGFQTGLLTLNLNMLIAVHLRQSVIML